MADVPDAILPAGSAELEKKKQRAPEVVKGTAQPAPRSLAPAHPAAISVGGQPRDRSSKPMAIGHAPNPVWSGALDYSYPCIDVISV